MNATFLFLVATESLRELVLIAFIIEPFKYYIQFNSGYKINALLIKQNWKLKTNNITLDTPQCKPNAQD